MTTLFNTLPQEVQDTLKDLLKAYDKEIVTYENGTYHYGLFIKSGYAPDFKVIGTFKAEDIYTPEERIINYIESFHDYPIQYKGKRDYRMLNNIENLRKYMTPEEFWNIKFKFNEEGNIEVA